MSGVNSSDLAWDILLELGRFSPDDPRPVTEVTVTAEEALAAVRAEHAELEQLRGRFWTNPEEADRWNTIVNAVRHEGALEE